MRRRLLGSAMGILGILMVGTGIVRYLGQQHPGTSLLAKTVLTSLIGILILVASLQSLSARGEVRVWVLAALMGTLMAHVLLGMLTEEPGALRGLLPLAGVLAAFFITLSIVMLARGYRWRRSDSKAFPAAKEADEDV